MARRKRIIGSGQNPQQVILAGKSDLAAVEAHIQILPGLEAVPTRAERTLFQLRGLSAVRPLQVVTIASFSLGDRVALVAL